MKFSSNVFAQKSLALFIASLLGFLAAGCSIRIGGDGSGRRRAAPGRTVTMQEIDAARDLTFSSDKQAALVRIAERDNLSPGEQAYLARAALEDVSFSSNQMKILLALIDSPNFSDEAKACILENLDALSFSNDREAILKAFDDREKARQKMLEAKRLTPQKTT